MKQLKFPRLNEVMISGRLTRDPHLKYLNDGTAVANIDIAFDNGYMRDGEWVQKPCYIQSTVWKEQAEKVSKELKKGSPVIIRGNLDMDSWEKDGKKNNRIKLVCRKLMPLEKGTPTEPADVARDIKYKPITNDDVPF